MKLEVGWATQCEGTISVRKTRMIILITKFEKVAAMTNATQALGDPFSNERLISKMTRTLPEIQHQNLIHRGSKRYLLFGNCRTCKYPDHL